MDYDNMDYDTATNKHDLLCSYSCRKEDEDSLFNCIDHLRECSECVKLAHSDRYELWCLHCGLHFNDFWHTNHKFDHICGGFALCVDCYNKLILECSADNIRKEKLLLKSRLDKLVETLKNNRTFDERRNDGRELQTMR